MGPTEIGDCAIIGDGRSAALVSRRGAVEWLCWPRFDSPSVFASLLDRNAGHFRIAPQGPALVRRSYVGDSTVLETRFVTADGELALTDLMTAASEEDKRSAPLPEHELLRIVECREGEVDVEVELRARPEYGARSLPLREGPLGVRLEDRRGLYTLRGEVPLTVSGDLAVGRFPLRAGERAIFSLTFDSNAPALLPPLGAHALGRAARTRDFWARWAARCTYRGPYREAVVRSLLTLKLLSFAPSGAIVAAPTTSLPERVGGDLNWDYRFCWLRDASMTVRAFFDLGFTDEATAFASWLLHSTRLTRPRVDVLYDVYGRRPPTERTLDHLDGHRGSKPVRINNGAVEQLQLDTYGELVDAVAQLHLRGVPLDRETQALLRALGHYVAAHWHAPDHGIWEPREAPAHHTHSRVACWAALDRLLALHDEGLLRGLRAERVRGARDSIRLELEARAWNRSLRSYTQTLEGDTVDASVLLMAWYGFTRADAPRMRATFGRLRERLEVRPALLYRYEQSRAAQEGAFGICSFWGAELLARGAGPITQAERWFRTLLGFANDVGLYAEEFDVHTGAPLGNFPQAFTHVGLIGAAMALEERWRRLEEAVA